jgi:hypothetical protein
VGDLNIHGTAAGDVGGSFVNLIAPFQLPTDNEVHIIDLKSTQENPGTNAVFVVEKSANQAFSVSTEIDRTVMVEPGTFVSTVTRIEVPGGMWVRVRYKQSGSAGPVSFSLIGKTSGAGIQT